MNDLQVDLIAGMFPEADDPTGFARRVLNTASTKAKRLGQRIYLMYDIGSVYFETEPINSNDIITYVDP